MGEDETTDRNELRRQVSVWLRADLAQWREILQSGESEARELVTRNLAQWATEPDLKGIRDPEDLAALSEAEREGWAQFWTEVSTLGDQARAGR